MFAPICFQFKKKKDKLKHYVFALQDKRVMVLLLEFLVSRVLEVTLVFLEAKERQEIEVGQHKSLISPHSFPHNFFLIFF